MNYVVLDFEANNQDNIKEIIEIGAVKVNENNEIIDTYQSFVKPTLAPTLNGFIKRLTGITQEDVDSARDFVEVFAEFSKWVEEDSSIVIWGNMDRRFLNKDLSLHNISSDMPERFVNIQTDVSKLLLHNDDISLKKAIQLLGIKHDGNNHRALNDAINTAKIFFKTKSLIEQQDQNQMIEINIEEDKDEEVVEPIRVNPSVKINFVRYQKYLKKLTIEELEVKMNMLSDILQKEVSKEQRRSNYLYSITVHKYGVVKYMFFTKRRKQILKKKDINTLHIDNFIKNANLLYTFKDCLVDVLNDDAEQYRKELQKKISKLRIMSKKYRKTEFLNFSKKKLTEFHKEIIEMIDGLNSSLFTREKYKSDLRGIYNRSTLSFAELDGSLSNEEVG